MLSTICESPLIMLSTIIESPLFMLTSAIAFQRGRLWQTWLAQEELKHFLDQKRRLLPRASLCESLPSQACV